MHYRYAQIDEQGICFAESQLAGPVDDPALIELAEGAQALGKRWDGVAWLDVPQDAGPRHITVAAFFKRFGAHMLPILTSPEPVVQALVMLVRSHTYIDLDDPVLAQYLPQLIDFGLMEQSEIDALLELDPQPGEEP